jgi:O-antigen ligase
MWREARTMLPLLALVCWIFASTLWSIDPKNTLYRAFHTVDHVVFAAYLVARSGWREIVALLTCAYGVIFILSVGAVLLAPDLGISNLEGYSDTWRGAFTQKNTLGAVAEVGVLISGYSFLTAANNRWIVAFVCVGQLLLLVMARSATSTISLVIALSVVVAAFGLFVHQRPVARLFALMTMLGGAIGGVILFISYDSVNEMMGRSASMTDRAPIWQYVLETAKTRPWLGYGYGF